MWFGVLEEGTEGKRVGESEEVVCERGALVISRCFTMGWKVDLRLQIY